MNRGIACYLINFKVDIKGEQSIVTTDIQAKYRTPLGTCKYVVGPYAQKAVHLLADALSCDLEASWSFSQAFHSHVKHADRRAHITLSPTHTQHLHTYIEQHRCPLRFRTLLSREVFQQRSAWPCGSLIHLKAACPVETQLWMMLWRSGSWGLIH